MWFRLRCQLLPKSKGMAEQVSSHLWLRKHTSKQIRLSYRSPELNSWLIYRPANREWISECIWLWLRMFHALCNLQLRPQCWLFRLLGALQLSIECRISRKRWESWRRRTWCRFNCWYNLASFLSNRIHSLVQMWLTVTLRSILRFGAVAEIKTRTDAKSEQILLLDTGHQCGRHS